MSGVADTATNLLILHLLLESWIIQYTVYYRSLDNQMSLPANTTTPTCPMEGGLKVMEVEGPPGVCPNIHRHHEEGALEGEEEGEEVGFN